MRRGSGRRNCEEGIEIRKVKLENGKRSDPESQTAGSRECVVVLDGGVQVARGKGFGGGMGFERIVEICGKIRCPVYKALVVCSRELR